MRAANPPGPMLDVWMLATAPDTEEAAQHAEIEIVDGDMAAAFDEIVPDLVAALRARIVGPNTGGAA